MIFRYHRKYIVSIRDEARGVDDFGYNSMSILEHIVYIHTARLMRLFVLEICNQHLLDSSYHTSTFEIC